MSAVDLARLQFAFTVSFHIIFPAFTIGLSAYIATLLLMWLRTGADRYHRLARYWTKIFAVSFAMGVVSGIVLSYQFGTNWSRFSEVVGNVVGPLIGYEVLTAFFLEATFLGIMLFGWTRVSPVLHAVSAIIVAAGTCLSAFWILAANSWMQTPVGHEMRDGIAYPVDWVQIIFNPSFPYRFVHMVTAAYLTTALVVLAVGARHLLANRFIEESKTMVRMAVTMIAITAPIQAFVGDMHGLNTLEHQPTKIAAMEGHWEGGKIADLILFAWPNEQAERNDYEIAVPAGASLILRHDPAATDVPALKDVPPDERPNVPRVFFAFRAMVGIGFLMIAIGWLGALLWFGGRLFETRLYLRAASWTWPLGFVAIISGWIVTESGRQPWLVQGILKTADAISPVSAGSVATTLILFIVVYGIVFSAGIYYINRLVNRGPGGAAVKPPEEGLPNRPLSGAAEAGREIMSPGQ